MTDAFTLTLIRQGWMAGCAPSEDLCSHGALRLVIGGVIIEDGAKEYGISASALALLRTVEEDHQLSARRATLVVCGCSRLMGTDCGIGIDWQVRHEGSRSS